MFQTYDVTSRPEQGPPRLARLRAEIAAAGLDGFLVPRADVHQGEYVAPRDARLEWLTGFTGSAGFCAVLPGIAGVFIDGRYRVQVRAQVDLGAFTPVPWPETGLGDWLKAQAAPGARIGFDPWLHTRAEIDKIAAALEGTGITLVPGDNLVDRIWADQPEPPAGAVRIQPETFTGATAADKRARIAAVLAEAGHSAVVLTLPDSISWLLNIRGGDVPRNPVVQALAVLHADGALDLCIDPAKLDESLRAHLGPEVRLHPADGLPHLLTGLGGPVRLDPASAPVALWQALGDRAVAGTDPCLLPKACKTGAEIEGARAAHLRDAVAMCRFLAWLDAEAPEGKLTEIAVAQRLEGFRRETNALQDISFESIVGAGAHGAIVHYRVTEGTDRPVRPGELLLVDSGGQYVDGTTDITRTVAVGAPPAEAAEAFTRVLQGMIAISRARFPKGLAGRDLDPLARIALWQAGQDYDHGTGHGVGSFLSVHEGPARIARTGEVPLAPGMILSNEPGHYREGHWGIRIENLIVVIPAPDLPGADPGREMYAFETLTQVPIDRRLIVTAMLGAAERAWIDAYHAGVLDAVGPRLDPATRDWLAAACAPL